MSATQSPRAHTSSHYADFNGAAWLPSPALVVPGGSVPNGPVSAGAAAAARRSPRAGMSSSPQALSRSPGSIALPPPISAHALAQQLSAQLAAGSGGGRKHSRSAPTSPMSRPARDMSLGLAPLSTITPIDMGGSPSASTSMLPPALPVPSASALGPAALIDMRSPEAYARRLSPELLMKPLSQVQQPQPRLVPGASQQPQRGVTVPQPQPRRRRARSRSNPRPPSSASSDDTDSTEVDSDSTFVPGRPRHQHSRSQPDLSALRSRLVEGWADGVMRTQMEERRARENSQSQLQRRRSHGRKTPPMRPIPLGPAQLSHPHLAYTSGIAPPLRHSPRQSTLTMSHLTPITSSPTVSPRTESSVASDDSNWEARSPAGGMTGSEDADDDFETDSPSSGSLSFSPKRARRRLVENTKRQGQALGLLLEPGNSGDEQRKTVIDIHAASIEARLRRSSLLRFRLLAIVPALWGIAVLTHALITGALWHDVWPWGVDFSREALERLVAGHIEEGIKRPVHRGDMIFAIAWAAITAHFCFCLTTGLTHRWRSYYSLPSTVTRLVSLQCLCWPATYMTLTILGARRPLLAWVVIGVTTGWSRTVQMWVTSNVVVDDISPSSTAGDVTPGPQRRRSPSPVPPPPAPSDLKGWRVFTYGRRWDWDAVAREVGWKVGGLLLVTSAWLFWRLEEAGV